MSMTPDEARFAPAWLQSELLSAETQETRAPQVLLPQKTSLIPGRGVLIAGLIAACLLSDKPVTRRAAMTLGLGDK